MNERFAQKNERFAHFWRAIWAIRSHRSFLVSDLSDWLTSLIKKEGMSESLIFFKNLQKNVQKMYQKYNFSQICLRELLVFCEWMSKWTIRPKNERFAHSLLYMLTWGNPSRSLFCHERHEGFAHSCSFVLSNRRELLTVTHLIWSIWANEQMSNWAMSKWANSQPWLLCCWCGQNFCCPEEKNFPFVFYLPKHFLLFCCSFVLSVCVWVGVCVCVCSNFIRRATVLYRKSQDRYPFCARTKIYNYILRCVVGSVWRGDSPFYSMFRHLSSGKRGQLHWEILRLIFFLFSSHLSRI